MCYIELLSVGLSVVGVDCNMGVSWSGPPNEPLAALVVAAHDKALSSDEAQALKAYLGGYFG